MPNLIHSKMSWPEMEQALPKLELALLPVGSHEQHGPNLGFATDSDRAFAMAEKLGERLYPKALVMAPLNYGVSYHHMRFPGTITLRHETLLNLLLDLAESLKQHGIKKVLMINGHGGNRSTLDMAAAKMRFLMNMRAAFIGCGTDMAKDYLEEENASPIRGHSCEGEVAQTMHLAPHLVKYQALSPGQLKDTPYMKRPWWGTVPWSFDEITANGALGDATRATPEMGERMTDIALDRLEAFAAEYFLGRGAPEDPQK